MTEAAAGPAQQGAPWQVATQTSVGRVRRRNEDAYGQAVALDGAQLLAVADGLGRFNAADVASKTAITAACAQWALEPAPAEDLAAALSRCIVAANQTLLNTQREQSLSQPLATTAVLLAWARDQAMIAHAGDSRAYLLRGGRLERLTADHVGPPEGDAAAHSWAPQSLITCCLGMQTDVQVEFTGPLTLQPDDLLLLCTDGLSRVVDDAWIEAALLVFPLDDAATTLIDLANFLGGPDNITAALLRFQPSSGGPLTPRPPTLTFPHERPERWSRRRNLILAWVLTLACIALWIVQMCSG
jgi:protein phosphatase